MRLITVTGPGGAGKTRLAREAASERADAFADGVLWIALDALREPALVMPAIARQLGASGDAATQIGARRLLLVLDNFEQVAPAANEVGSLLAACPRLSLLVTSREPLHLAGEHEYAALPLASDDAQALFLARARAVNAAFEDDGSVAELCRRLEGIPLAIELAASRAKLLAPRALLARLRQRLPVLAGGAADLPERQRTLRGAIAWSHDLLSDDERRTFARLAVFSGGFVLEDAEVVTGAALDSLAALVDKSLVRRTRERLGMLETIREFAQEQLETQADRATLRRAHARHYLALLEAAVDAIRTPAEMEAFYRSQLELDNVRTAFEWALAHDESELGLRIAVTRSVSLRGRSDRSESRGWMERALARGVGTPALRAKGYAECSHDALMHGDNAAGERHAHAALALAREIGDEKLISGLLRALCLSALDRGDFAAAERLAAESYELSVRVGHVQSLHIALVYLGYAKHGAGDYAAAEQHFEAAAARFGETGDELLRAHARKSLADAWLEQGRTREAKQLYHDTLRSCLLLREQDLIAQCVAGLAASAAEEGEYADAARLWGALEGAERLHGVHVAGYERARAALGEAQFASAHAAGVALSERARDSGLTGDATSVS